MTTLALCILYGLAFTRLLQIIGDLYTCIEQKLYSPIGLFFGAVILFLIQFVIGFILKLGYDNFIR
jgi:tetrahydromethanopterin S-methyltransferase subunit G